ncbi:hypothetical protein [Flavihumibacter petaseus]|uniref:Uncharacterized protein n=1 Tax=Flavihumibacter petaseus NBRC 106054 TaxID=1220578 RepID=A0A0E9MXQ5_9BACT|nr:hypothetical protein [Flavihumibacter petaseus]GAO42497.1 hypothetical protein FPE01S_01_15110 [Flavihumibacter petaseus NBRC 106054]
MKKILTILALFITATSFATPTRLLVRVKAKDAKFIGTGIGGAYVVVRNHLSGDVLSKGVTTGASGNTDLIMLSAHQRNQRLTDAKTAGFEASIDISEPLLVDVEVTAPLSRKNAAVNGSTQLWLIPGKHIEGEGLVIELPGYILDILSPTTHAFLTLPASGSLTVDVKASLTMLCGCTITKGGTWNADDIEVVVLIKKDDKPLREQRLQYSGTANIFSSPVALTEKGAYGLSVYAYDPKTGNTGVDNINFVIQ